MTEPDTPDFSRRRFLLHFYDPRLESAYIAEQSQVALVALRLCVNISLLIAGISLLLQTLIGLPWSNPMMHLLIFAVLVIGAVRTLLVRITARHAFVASAAFALMAGASISIVSPIILAREFPISFLLRYGYFGLVIFAMLPFLLLRVPLKVGIAINTIVVFAYATVLAHTPSVPTFDFLLYIQSALVGMLVGAGGGWLFEKMQRDSFAQRKLIEVREAQLAREHQRAEELLLNILPAAIGERLKNGGSPIAEAANEVSVLFADLVGFTPFAAARPPAEVVRLLDAIFRRCDELALVHGLEKIKTIGDAYLAVAGLPYARVDHAAAAAGFALAIQDAVAEIAQAHGADLAFRIGIDSGPVVAGVIGQHKFSYDVWGDTVNRAARMESHGEAKRIQISSATAQLLSSEFELEERGDVEVKGKGRMRTFWLLRMQDPSAARLLTIDGKRA